MLSGNWRYKYLSFFSRLEGNNLAEKSRDERRKDTLVIQMYLPYDTCDINEILSAESWPNKLFTSTKHVRVYIIWNWLWPNETEQKNEVFLLLGERELVNMTIEPHMLYFDVQ